MDIKHAILIQQKSRQELHVDENKDLIMKFSTPNGIYFTIWCIFYLSIWLLALYGIIVSESLWVKLLLSLAMGSLLHTLTILQHDCGHQSAYKSKILNLWVGRFLAWFIYMPFTTFTELHRWHHTCLGQSPKDPDAWFYADGNRWLFLRECLFMPRFIYLSLTRDDIKSEHKTSIKKELCFNTITLVVLCLVLILIGRYDIALFGFILPMLSLGCIFNPISRGIEHYPLSCMSVHDERRLSLQHNTLSIHNRLLGLLWANINYHVEHHVYPRVAFYRLPAVTKLIQHKPYLKQKHLYQNLRKYKKIYTQN